ncbi:MAG: monovalent cation/H+ antiporter complex subunit F [Actinomycetota bacterium]
MIASIALCAFGLTFVAAGIRAVIGPTLADRVTALDVGVVSIMGAVAVDAADTGSTRFVPVLVVMAIVGFTATVAASRFIEHQGSAR